MSDTPRMKAEERARSLVAEWRVIFGEPAAPSFEKLIKQLVRAVGVTEAAARREGEEAMRCRMLAEFEIIRRGGDIQMVDVETLIRAVRALKVSE